MRKPKFPRFFKVFLEEDLAFGRVLLPRSFAKKHGNDIGEKAFLQVPSGSTWKVEVGRREDGLWLENGWREFEEYYSLARGSFLAFEYRSKGFFHVFIFDKSATQIDYPCDADGGDDSLSVKRERPPFPCPQPQKVARKSVASTPDFHTSSVLGEARVQQCSSDHNSKLSDKIRRKVTADEKANIRFRAITSSQSANPTMKLVMKPSHIQKRLDIPFSFAKRHLKNDCEIVLRNVEGRTWSVYCWINHAKQQAYFGSWWTDFARENDLKDGNMCVFELINTAEFELKVTIIRAIDSHPSVGPILNTERVRTIWSPDKDCGGKEVEIPTKNSSGKMFGGRSSCSKAVEAAEKFTSKNPYFKAVMKANKIHNSVQMPREFVKEMKGEGKRVRMEVEKGVKRWEVKVNGYPKYRIWAISKGWSGFSRENGLKEGDICVFELVERESSLLKVSIFRC